MIFSWLITTFPFKTWSCPWPVIRPPTSQGGAAPEPQHQGLLVMVSSSHSKDSASRFLESPWLDGVDPLIRRRIWQTLRERSEPIGTALLAQDQPTTQLWFVAEGSVAVERTKPGKSNRPEILAQLDGPAIYGTTTFFRDARPSMTVRTTTPTHGWTLDRASYERLRTEDPLAAEALALTVVKVLSERFDMLDHRLTSLMADHHDNHHRVTEWANFRSRLFEEPAA